MTHIQRAQKSCRVCYEHNNSQSIHAKVTSTHLQLRDRAQRDVMKQLSYLGISDSLPVAADVCVECDYSSPKVYEFFRKSRQTKEHPIRM